MGVAHLPESRRGLRASAGPCLQLRAASGRAPRRMWARARGSGTGPALTGVIDQGRGSKMGC